MGLPLAGLALPALSAGLGAYEGYKKGGGTGALIGAGLVLPHLQDCAWLVVLYQVFLL